MIFGIFIGMTIEISLVQVSSNGSRICGTICYGLRQSRERKHVTMLNNNQ